MNASVEPAAPVTLFYSYAHEDTALRDELQGHLKILERRGLLAPWHDRKIAPGQDWSSQIDAHLRSAELVLLLVSKDFIESDYIMGTELGVAMQRHAEQKTVVVPIVVRAVDLDPDDAQDLPFLKLQGLPTGLRPVTSWANRDEAWTDVAKGLRATVKTIRERQARRAAPMPGPLTPPKVPLSSGVAPPPDPVLERLIDDVTLQVGQAQQARGQPPLDPDAVEALQADTRAMIDLPEQKRVLWVDDRPEGNRFEAAALAKLQIEVVSVRSTEEALRRLADDTEGFDLVISDWERELEPKDAGLRLLASVRSMALSLPLIHYHAASGPRRAERAAQARAAGALGEAVTPAELMVLVQKALGG